MTDDDKKEDTPPGPPVKWVTIRQEYDRQDRLVGETRTEVVETDVPQPEQYIPGHYL
jgi:hypothetical protein